MIIVEGPDGAGKSTLIRKLSVCLDAESIIRWNIPPKTPEELASNLMHSKAIATGSEVIIQDRTPWITEPIYETLKYGTERAAKWLYYQTGVALLRAPLIYCRPPDHVIRKHAPECSSPCDTPAYLNWIAENVEDLIYLYDEFFKSIRHTRYDWTTDTLPDLEKKIRRKKAIAILRSSSKASTGEESKVEARLQQLIPKIAPGD